MKYFAHAREKLAANKVSKTSFLLQSYQQLVCSAHQQHNTAELLAMPWGEVLAFEDA